MHKRGVVETSANYDATEQVKDFSWAKVRRPVSNKVTVPIKQEILNHYAHDKALVTIYPGTHPGHKLKKQPRQKLCQTWKCHIVCALLGRQYVSCGANVQHVTKVGYVHNSEV
jgi:hypothetical protein